ncbi:olfactory receptor 56A5-like [Thalassophryne amazonica]|uniref:olfactory receptor 56A5-like n=1 Tax=Thalassophryne amazonica TaxID=390379 RepID=UPI001472416A|nr:olfactory receptor 56A5-like [Thalassophryne amazonica]
MENQTFNTDMLNIEGLKVSSEASIPVFTFLLLTYIFIMVSNISLFILISLEKSLHQPMYLLFCNMIVNDVFEATAIIPPLLSQIFVPITDRYIHYVNCVIQAFFAHFHACAAHTVLMIMAFDRYVAICKPLGYSTIMTNRMVVKLSVSAWVVAFTWVSILLGLTIRLSRCRQVIFNPFCENASLFKLSCESVLINQIYGLGSTIVILGSSLGSITLTYLKIAAVCLSRKNKVLNSRALQTCASHLTLYLLMLVLCIIAVTLHRFPDLSDQQKVASVMLHVIPPALDPVIYGLQIQMVRQKLLSYLRVLKDNM